MSAGTEVGYSAGTTKSSAEVGAEIEADLNVGKEKSFVEMGVVEIGVGWNVEKKRNSAEVVVVVVEIGAGLNVVMKKSCIEVVMGIVIDFYFVDVVAAVCFVMVMVVEVVKVSDIVV